jgi:CHAT domain-containing protein/tetratricopeptide (TPR) repeat protein
MPSSAGTEPPPIEVEEAKRHVAYIERAMAATAASERDVALAEGFMLFGSRFGAGLDYMAALEGETPGRFASVRDAGLEVLAAWLGGRTFTQRADEDERRVAVAHEALDSSGPLIQRLAAVAILELPEGHELRDVTAAREALKTAYARACEEDDVQGRLLAAGNLIANDLVDDTRAAELIDEGLAVAERCPDGGIRREFRLAVLRHHVGRAIEARDAGDDKGWRAWSAEIDQSVKLVVTEDPELGPEATKNLSVVALALDVAGRETEAADAYARIRAAAGPEDTAVQRAGLREASLRLRLGDPEGAINALVPIVGFLEERYISAVRDHDIEDAGNAFSEALVSLAFAEMRLQRWERALQALDRSKSLRLRYRAALAERDEGRNLLRLERALYAATRGAPLPTGVDDEPAIPFEQDAVGSAVTPRTRLLEAYREARPQLSPELLTSPMLSEIASSLAPDEAAVALALDWAGTGVIVVCPGDVTEPTGAFVLDELPMNAWIEALLGEEDDGWLFAIGAPEADIDRPRALERLLEWVDAAIGHPLAQALPPGTTRIILAPHRTLHIVPFWALPTLAHLDVLIAPSFAQLVHARRRGARPLNNRAVIVSNPTDDLVLSAAEVGSVGRWLSSVGIASEVFVGADATEGRIALAVAGASIVHVSAHGQSEVTEPTRSALLLHPEDAPLGESDPFQAWTSGIEEWHEVDDENRYGDVPGIGRVYERLAGTRLERWLERGNRSTLYGLYGDGGVVVAELWTAGDVMLEETLGECRLAVLSACESAVPGGTVTVDEYSGLSASLQLAGADTVVGTMWPVGEDVASLFVEQFYRALADGPPELEVAAIVRECASRLRDLSGNEASALLDELAEATDDARAAFVLESRARQVVELEQPYANPWAWATFYVTGSGKVLKEAR